MISSKKKAAFIGPSGFRRLGLFTRVSVITFFMLSLFSFRKSEKDILDPSSTVIVLPDKADPLETESASTINKWLRKIYQTDSGFTILKESLLTAAKGKTVIAIGATKFNSLKDIQNLPPYSFVINKKENVVTICGVNNMGTLIGAGYFLDHFCGVRFYMPGDLFTGIPKSHTITLSKTIAVKEIPSTKYVMSTGYNDNGDIHWAYINGLYRKDWGSHQHTMGDRFFNDSVIKKFPEIFPLINGQRYFPSAISDQKWEPDFAEPKLVDAAVFSAIQYFRSHPIIDYISFSVQDSRVYPKEGKMGEYLKSYPQTPAGQMRGYTNAYIEFLNKLAIRLQDELPKSGFTTPKTIVYIPYGEVSDIPTTKLNSSILPVTVLHVPESLMDSVYNEGPNGNKDYRLSEWAKITTRIGNHDWAEGRGFIYPRIYTKLVSKFARTVKKNKMQFEYAHIEAYPNWALDGPKLYFMGKIYWNPGADPDSLLTRFCTDMFGKANNKMKAYFIALEDLNTSMNNDPKRNRRMGSYPTQLSLNEKELQIIKQARQLLNGAANMATGDGKKRIEFFSMGFKISEYFFDLYNSKNINEQKAGELRGYLKETVAGDGMTLNMAKDADFITKMDAVIDNIIQAKKRLQIK